MKFLKLRSIKNYIKSIIWGLVILFSGTIPANKISKISLLEIRHMDKLLHFLLYLIFSLILYFDLRRNTRTLKDNFSIYFFIFFIPFFWGMIMELIQYYLITNRQGSIADIIANICGIFTGILLVLIAGKYFVRK
jgi:VanZ family protein